MDTSKAAQCIDEEFDESVKQAIKNEPFKVETRVISELEAMIDMVEQETMRTRLTNLFTQGRETFKGFIEKVTSAQLTEDHRARGSNRKPTDMFMLFQHQNTINSGLPVSFYARKSSKGRWKKARKVR